MSDAVLQTIELVKSEVRAIEAQLAEKRKIVNSLCAMVGQPPFYAAVDVDEPSMVGITSGEFYGQPLAGVVRKILEKRRLANQGPASVAEIYDAMLQGDFGFESSNPENAKRVLRISLTKNVVFHRLPSGKYGLREWYPAIKRERKANGAGKKEAADEGDQEMDEAEAFHESLNTVSDTDVNGAETVAGKRPR